ncbi:MAG: type 2 isopentenyl-diphosphate Delta-isomerase [Polyangiaceae bacterium]|nr:type 2 isopentenyl-diphosphate Delta-isomerase [Polyangiaceae bacterium]
MADISRRKDDHLDLAARGDVGFRRTGTLLSDVVLLHDSLPELSLDEVDASVELFGKRLAAPVVIASMTGGSERARSINETLAGVAEELGLGFGLGSQRAMHRDPGAAGTFRVRDLAPRALVLGNLGGVQAAKLSTSEVAALVAAVGADALCVHLNPAQELVQPEGDRDFRGVLDALGRLARELPVPVVAKETGCGLGPSAGRRLRHVGVEHVDVSGAGGTSWVAVETERAAPGERALGEAFREWGIPTAASVAWMARLGFSTVIATGGVATGLDVARALALGATAAGIARPVLQALEAGGRDAALAFLAGVVRELRAAMLLVGARDVTELAATPRIVRGELARWLDAEAGGP